MDRGCTVEKCRKPHEARGLCRTHYAYARRHGGDPIPRDRPPHGCTPWVYVNFYTAPPTTGGCTEWSGRRGPQGYGIAGPSRFPEKAAHRLAWHVARGPIPDGLFVLHACDNPPCVNVEHLWLGTIAENNRDRAEKGRGRKPDLTREFCPLGHSLQDPENLLKAKNGGLHCRTCHLVEQAKWRAKRRAEDPEGFREAQREATARYRAKDPARVRELKEQLRAADPEGFKRKQREATARYRARQRASPPK